MGLQETIGGQIKVGRNKWVQTQVIISWKTIFSEQKRIVMSEDKDKLVDMLFSLIKDDEAEDENKLKSSPPRSSPPRSRSRSVSSHSSRSRKSSIFSRSRSRSVDSRKSSPLSRKSSSSRSRSRSSSRSRSRSRSSSLKAGITHETIAVEVVNENPETKKVDIRLPNFKYKEKHILHPATSDLCPVFDLRSLKKSHPTFCSNISTKSSSSDSDNEEQSQIKR